MIASATLRDLKTILEVRILDLLGTSDEPLRREDIIESLKTNGKRCGTALKNLVEKGLVTKSEKFRVTLYEASVKLQIVPAGVRIVPHEVQNESAPSPTRHTRIDPPHPLTVETESESIADFSMFPDTTRRLLTELWDAPEKTLDKEDIRQDVIGDEYAHVTFLSVKVVVCAGCSSECPIALATHRAKKRPERISVSRHNEKYQKTSNLISE